MSTAKKQINKKLQQAIQKTKQKDSQKIARNAKKTLAKKSYVPFENDEIDSDEINSVESDHDKQNNKDDFFIAEEGTILQLLTHTAIEENIDDKKTRLAKELISKIDQNIDDNKMDDEEEDEFLKNLKGQDVVDKNDLLATVLKRKAMDVKGKLHHKVADKLIIPECTSVFIKGHKKAITDFVFTKDEKKIYSVSKDCCILEWDLTKDTKIVFNKGKKHDRTLKNGGHYDEIMAVDLSRDQKLLATGGKDRLLRIWDTKTRTLVTKFKGHTDTITSVRFDNENDHLYSVSADMSLKIWKMREMAYIDTHYGHLRTVFDLQAYSKDRLITCGDDRQVIFWKVVEDTQLLYKNTKSETNCLTILDDEHFITASNQSTIDVWTFKKKKPVSKNVDSHTYFNPDSPHKHS